MFTGRAAALQSALTQADDDLASGRIATGWLLAFDFSPTVGRPTIFAAVRLGVHDRNLSALLSTMRNDLLSLRPSAALRRALRLLPPQHCIDHDPNG